MALKKFFRIEDDYKFEWNDLRSLLTVINILLIIVHGLSISWFGLAVAVFGVVKDLVTDHRLNSLVMHSANAVLYSYLLLLFYQVL